MCWWREGESEGKSQRCAGGHEKETNSRDMFFLTLSYSSSEVTHTGTCVGECGVSTPWAAGLHHTILSLPCSKEEGEKGAQGLR